MNSNMEIGIHQPQQPPIPPKGRVWIDKEVKKDEKKKEEERICDQMDEYWTAVTATMWNLTIHREG
jgi:hypothetical protein